ncbi:MAG: hypothetical protein AMXMBFR59_40480 [Rhodanobacteraceae bacterium]
MCRATYCSFRDTHSLEQARSLGYAGQGRVFPDLAFSLPADVLPAGKSRGVPAVVGVGLMGYFGWNRSEADGQAIYEAYLERMARLVAEIVRRGYPVQLLIGDTRADRDVSSDLLASSALVEFDQDQIRPACLTEYRGILDQIGGVDVIVATRFHNVLFGLLLEKPVVSLSYADKNDALMRSFGLAGYCHDVERFDADVVLEQVMELLGRRNVPDPARRELLDDSRRALDIQYNELCGLWTSLT